jgi:putative transposase
VERHRWRCLAYCLMGNHYHLVIKLTEANLAAGMQVLNGVYARRFNRDHRCRGHLFERRYAAEHVARDAHLLEALRYSDLNPVRAGLCPHPARWRWSSYRAVVGEIAPPRLLAFEDVLALFGDGLPNARRRYVRFVEEGLEVDRAWHQRSSPVVPV